MKQKRSLKRKIIRENKFKKQVAICISYNLYNYAII